MNTSSTSNKSRKSSVNQQLLQDLSIELESAQNELAVIQLEKLEYEKELNKLKEENEELTKENDEFYEISEIEQQEILYLRQVSINVDQENNDLQSQNYRYQQIIKHLRSENESLQKENEKYKSIFEQLFEQNQKKDEIHTNNISHLENKLKQLQFENDQLRQEMNTIIPSDNIPNINITELPIKSSRRSSIDIEKRKYSLTIDNNEHFDEFKLEKELDINIDIDIDTPSNTTMITKYDEEDDNNYIMAQLAQFGYEREEVMEAMKMITNKDDINQIIEYLDNVQNTTYPYSALDAEIKQKQVMIDSLQKQNQDSKIKISKLQSKIKELRQKNKRLIMKQNMKKASKEPSCFWSFRLW